jgi:hypothetical protein
VTVREIAAYLARAEKVLTHGEQEAVAEMIARNPTCGVLVEGMGGVRKVRIGASGRGKRGGARVIYYFHGEAMPVCLLALFAKNEKADLTPAERKALVRLVELLQRSHGVKS